MGLLKIRMPDVGEGIVEAEIVEWNVAVGDLVREDDVLGAIMTDKATVELPSPSDGKISAIDAEVGVMTAVGSTIITLEVEGEGQEERDTPPTPAPVTVEASPPDLPAEPSESPASRPRQSQASRQAPAGPPRPEGEKPIASPSVRRRAMDAGVKLAFVRGTGPAGRILHGDLDAYLSGPVPSAIHAREPDTSIIETKVTGLRRKIAERLEDANRRIPHITYVDEVDVTELENLRSRLNSERGDDQPKLTLLPFIMLSMVAALKAFPKLNALYDDEAGVVRQFGAAHIGMAVQTSNGLMVAVVRHAETLDINGLAAESQRLATAARDGSITRDELTGSTITVTSLGAMGGIVSTPVLNSPEVAIVGVNKIAMRPVYLDGGFVPRKVMNLSSSFDHRIIDGWDAAEFIQHIRASLENPATLFMEQ
ncbi:MAG: 2-oxo acid dehydrogenase subunit E2 [Alphaproteobacteria bacterium]|nr:2-oxo acid dehydrogenase subunit E2 [Alphaproteobacteria bacterium]